MVRMFLSLRTSKNNNKANKNRPAAIYIFFITPQNEEDYLTSCQIGKHVQSNEISQV